MRLEAVPLSPPRQGSAAIAALVRSGSDSPLVVFYVYHIVARLWSLYHTHQYSLRRQSRISTFCEASHSGLALRDRVIGIVQSAS
jgi:hypothetical protein